MMFLPMVALLAGGHCLFEGAPGAARASTVAKLSAALNLSFSRICCTSELLPEELVGSGWDINTDSSGTTSVGNPLYVCRLKREGGTRQHVTKLKGVNGKCIVRGYGDNEGQVFKITHDETAPGYDPGFSILLGPAIE